MEEFSHLLGQYKIEPPERIPLGLDDLMLNWLESKQTLKPLRLVFKDQAKRTD